MDSAQGIGRSRGGLSTKVHLIVDAMGLLLTFEITEGQRRLGPDVAQFRVRQSVYGHGHGHAYGENANRI